MVEVHYALCHKGRTIQLGWELRIRMILRFVYNPLIFGLTDWRNS
jgi:hypothetical protein